MKKSIIITISIIILLGLASVIGWLSYKAFGTQDHSYFVGYTVTTKTNTIPSATIINTSVEVQTGEDIKAIGQGIFNSLDPKPEGVLVLSIYKLK